MNFKEQVNIVARELSTKAYVEYSAIVKLVKLYGVLNVGKAIKALPLKHPNPVAYIIKYCSGKGTKNIINTDIFNK